MNQQFSEFSEQGGFATALASTFFAPTQSFALCNAGHPPPLVFRRSTSQWEELANYVERPETVTDTPLGIAGEASYCQLEVRLQTGDMVLSFSDAVTESEDGDGRQLGREGVLQLVRDLDIQNSAELIPAVSGSNFGDVREQSQSR